jgi:hypothetical protein
LGGHRLVTNAHANGRNWNMDKRSENLHLDAPVPGSYKRADNFAYVAACGCTKRKPQRPLAFFTDVLISLPAPLSSRGAVEYDFQMEFTDLRAVPGPIGKRPF